MAMLMNRLLAVLGISKFTPHHTTLTIVPKLGYL